MSIDYETAVIRMTRFAPRQFFIIPMLLLWACQPDQETYRQQPPPEVTIATPMEKQITEWDEYTGRLRGVETVDIRARVNGYLESIHFKDGALVKQGDLLFVIDPRPYKATLDGAAAELERSRIRLQLAKNDLDRAKRLFKSRAISEEELDARTQEEKQAKAALTVARAAVRSASLEVEFTEIRSPIDGRIGRNLVDLGNLVNGGTANSTLLATIVSLDPIHVYFTADERSFLKYLRLAREGVRPSSRNTPNPVQLGLADEEGFPHQGHMDFVDNRVDEATGTMQGRAIFDNPNLTLTPGLFARVRLLGKGPYRALLIPDEAILADQAKKYVLVIDDQNTVNRRYVTLGRIVDGLRVIEQGLKVIDKVIINGVLRAREGSIVKPREVEITVPTAAAKFSR